jgi:Fe2+ or Zn2+ uptake regulation protein
MAKKKKFPQSSLLYHAKTARVTSNRSKVTTSLLQGSKEHRISVQTLLEAPSQVLSAGINHI